jgi:phosphate-selective porin
LRLRLQNIQKKTRAREGENMKNFVIGILTMCLLSTVLVCIADAQKQSYPTLKVNGYIQASYTMDKDKVNNFQVKRARGKLSGNANENIKYSLLFDFIDDNKGSNLADAYIDVNYLPQANVRMGQFKTPFSMEYLASATEWDTIELAQVVSKLAPKRDIGIQIGGEVSPLLEYAVGVFNGTGSNAAEENKRKDIVARGVIKPVKGFLLGVSHYEGWSGKEDENKTKRRTDAQIGFINEPLSVKGEFIFGKNGETSVYGWYAQFGYTLSIPIGKSSQKLQPIVKYDSYDPNGDKEKDKTDIATIGLNWFITKNAKLQVNNQLILNEDFEVDNDIVAAQFQATW